MFMVVQQAGHVDWHTDGGDQGWFRQHCRQHSTNATRLRVTGCVGVGYMASGGGRVDTNVGAQCGALEYQGHD